MIRSPVSRIMEALMLMISVCSLMCFAFAGEFSPERLDKIHEEDKQWSVWLEKYIKNVLYVGMPEDEFVKLFTKEKSWNDSQRPYIIEHVNNDYYFIGRRGIRYKVTFRNELLEHLAQRTWEKIPVITTHYADFTHILKGYKYQNIGLFKGMSEENFLKNFSNQIISKLNSGYLILAKDRHKYGIQFTEGILTHVWLSD